MVRMRTWRALISGSEERYARLLHLDCRPDRTAPRPTLKPLYAEIVRGNRNRTRVHHADLGKLCVRGEKNRQPCQLFLVLAESFMNFVARRVTEEPIIPGRGRLVREGAHDLASTSP